MVFGRLPLRSKCPAYGIQYYTTKTIQGLYIKWPAITLVQSTSIKYGWSARWSRPLAFEVTTIPRRS